MKEDINDIEDLLGKYLAGEASAEECTRAETWIAQNETNRSYFNHLQLIFDRAKAIKDVQDFDADKAWTILQSKLSASKGKTVPFAQTQILLRVAAFLAVAVGIGFLTYQWLNPPDRISTLTATTEIVKDSLPDGSLTVLNRGTKIRFVSNRRERKVALEGEAFFDVKHHADKPFSIEAGGLIIEDIGTAFNVKALHDSPLVEVYVESGEVSMHTLTSEGFNLVAGQTGVFDKRNQLFSRIQQLDTNRLAYKTGIFTFRDVTLETILHDLNSLYNIKIKVKDARINNCHLTVTFKNERVEDIVEIIAESLNLSVTKEGADYVLDGTGCEH